MNIVFLAPPVDTKSLPDNYKQLISIIKKLDNKVIDDYVTGPHKDIQTRYKSILTSIKQSDGLVVEGTEITAEMSRLTTLALQYHIPTLILYQKNDPEAFVFETSRLLSLKKYDKRNISKRLETFFNQINKQRLLYRFNLMLSKEMTSFIMDKSKQSDLSKADYIRNLILQDMNKK